MRAIGWKDPMKKGSSEKVVNENVASAQERGYTRKDAIRSSLEKAGVETRFGEKAVRGEGK